VVRSKETADPGAIVVALVDGEVTVKRLGKQSRKSRKGKMQRTKGLPGERPGLWLLPENPKYEPIPVTEETQILGEVATLVRDYA